MDCYLERDFFFGHEHAIVRNSFKIIYFLGPATKNKLMDLKRQLRILNTQASDNISTGSAGLSNKDNVRAEIDNILGSECLYCGEIMIRNINLPFIEDEDYDRVVKEWD